MSNQILQDTLNTTDIFLDTAFEIPLEQEILLADYDLPVFKIIHTAVQHTVTRKYINGSRLIIEGFFRTEIYYQSPSPARITSVSKKIPFQKRFELPHAVQQPYYINTDGSLQYVNTRAVNSSRIESRGIYRIAVKGYSSAEAMVSTAIDSTSVCTENTRLDYFALAARAARQFSVEEELSFERQPGRILHIRAFPGSMTTQLHQDKINVRGDIAAQIIYTDDDGVNMYRINKPFRYNQMIDMPGVDEGCTACADISVMAVTVAHNSRTDNINCHITCRRDAKAFRKQSVMAVTDAFSKKWGYTTESSSIVYDSDIIPVTKNMSVSAEDTIDRGYEIIHCTAQSTSPAISEEDGIPVLKSQLTFVVIAKNAQGEYECFTKTESFILNISQAVSADNEYILAVNVSGCTPQLSGNLLKVKADITISGYIICHSSINTLTVFEEDEGKPIKIRKGFLVLYYGSKGEKIFDIAKRYKTDIQRIIAENAVENSVLTEDRVLFIPSFRQ